MSDTTPRIHADGQLASSKGTLYTVETGTRIAVTFWRVFNTGSGSETVKAYIKPGSTSRQIGQYTVAAKGYADIVEPGQVFYLEAGDLLEGETTTGTTVDYVISGWSMP